MNPRSDRDLDAEFTLDDEREVDLDDDVELIAPTTIDPDERFEIFEEDPEVVQGDGPREI